MIDKSVDKKQNESSYKNGVIFILFLLLPLVSAVAADMKTEYSQGETIIAKISGNFVSSLDYENVFFYRGHVKVPFDFDIAKIGDYYYVKASLIGKTPENYSMRIENITYYEAGSVVDKETVTNFSINNNTADFSIDPGFIISSQDFSIEVQNLQDSSITLSIKNPSGIISEDSITIGPQQIKNIDFQLDLTEDLTDTIKLSTSKLDYVIPVSIFGQEKNKCGNEEIDSGESCDGDNWGYITGCSDFGFTEGHLSCNSPGSSNECLFDTSECSGDSDEGSCGDDEINAGEQCDGDNWGSVKGCENFGFSKGELLCIKCSFDTSNCSNIKCVNDTVCSDDQECKEGICVQKEECGPNKSCNDDKECVDNKCVAKNQECGSDKNCTQGKICNKGICIDIAIQKTCTELGGRICGQEEICEGNSSLIGGNTCCSGICNEAPKSSILKIIGWSLVVIAILFLLFFYLKYKRARKKIPNLVELGSGGFKKIN